MAKLTNKSELSDDLFYSLSTQGQECANRAAKPISKPGAKKLSQTQIRTLLLAKEARDSRPFGIFEVRDTRAAHNLCELGLLKHLGQGSLLATSSFKATPAGLSKANALTAVKKINLSSGELAFMQSAKDEAGGVITPGTQIQFDHTEGRAVAGLAKKGLILRLNGEVEVTVLGAGWFSQIERQE